MLHINSDVILSDTYQLLRTLQSDEELEGFFLVGGTALALQIGHRFSVDLDLFSESPFDTQHLSAHLIEHYNFQLNAVKKNTLLGVIESVKTDFITHAYPLIEPLVRENDLRIASVKDIGAMKLNAIAHSGQRLKDFIDVFYILEHFPLVDIMEAYQIKYSNSNPLIPLKGLTYFEDIDPDIDPPTMKNFIHTKDIKARLIEAVDNPSKRFISN